MLYPAELQARRVFTIHWPGVSLPILYSLEYDRASMRDVSEDNPQPLRGVRVVVVDDHRDTREMYDYILTTLGAVVTAVDRTADAVAILEELDVVVTDVAMPDLDGVWLLEQARIKAPGLPVIALSGYVREQSARLAGASFDRLLLKPVDPWQLASEIGAVLSRRLPRTIGGGSSASPWTLFFDLGIARKAHGQSRFYAEMLAASAESRCVATDVRAVARQLRTRAASLRRRAGHVVAVGRTLRD